MLSCTKPITFAIIALTVAAGTAQAQTSYIPAPAPTQPLVLPEVNIQAPRLPQPRHYQVPAGYDSDVTMHPYTSGIGPCTEGASPSQGCHHPTGTPIPPSHYERPPFNQP